MADTQLGSVLQQLRRLAGTSAAASDAELLDHFATRRDETKNSSAGAAGGDTERGRLHRATTIARRASKGFRRAPCLRGGLWAWVIAKNSWIPPLSPAHYI